MFWCGTICRKHCSSCFCVYSKTKQQFDCMIFYKRSGHFCSSFFFFTLIKYMWFPFFHYLKRQIIIFSKNVYIFHVFNITFFNSFQITKKLATLRWWLHHIFIFRFIFWGKSHFSTTLKYTQSERIKNGNYIVRACSF